MAALPAISRGQSFTFNNPLAPGGDPWVQLYNGTYYYTDTTGGDLMIAGGSTIPGVLTAPMTDVLHLPSGFGNVWAPELHYSPTDNRWFAYFAATTPTLDHRQYVAESATSNPLGGWSFLGQMTDPTNDWAIDGTTLTIGSKCYSIWSGWPGSVNGIQNLYVAPMSNLHTIGGGRTLISWPTNAWERVGGNPDGSLPYVNEGPEILTSPSGTTTLIYSASGSFTDSYCLGMLTLTPGADPTLAASWVKDDAAPVFQSANGVYAPGHASFTTSENGTRHWIVYHANVQSLASGGAVFNRNVRTQPFFFNSDGTPSFGQPVPVTVPIQYGPVNWAAAINGSADDSAHQYDNAANWVGGAITDRFVNVTLTDDTTLYLAGDRPLAGRWSFTYGSGQKFLSFQSTDANAHAVTLNGGVDMATLGGANSLYFSVGVRPLTLALGTTTPTFNLSAGNSFYVDGNLTGTVGLTVNNGGSLVFRNGGKTYAGTTLVNGGTLSAGDGSATGIATGNLSATSPITLGPAGTLQLAGLAGSAEAETIPALTGTGTVTGVNPAGSTLAVANAAADTFAGTLSGPNLLFTTAGPAPFTLTGPSSNLGGLRLTGGSLVVAAGAAVTTAAFSSVGLNAGQSAALAVNGSLTVNDSLNVGDNGKGTLALSAGSSLAVKTLSVAKYGSSVGAVTQTGGTVTSLPGGSDWQIGSAAGAAGTFALAGGSLNTAYNLQVGATGRGTLTQTGGTVAVGGFLSIGRYPGATGTYDLSAGTGSLTATTQSIAIVGEQGTGTLLLGGSSLVTVQSLAVGLNGGAGTVTQTGGTLSTASVTRGTGTATIHFDGGTLAATAAAPTFLQGLTTADVRGGGATVNTGPYAVTIGQPLLHAASLGTTLDGGLTKAGTGTLTLSGANTYTGPTTVTAGTLAFPAGSVPTIRTLGALAVVAGRAVVNAPASPSARTLLVTTGLSANAAAGAAIDLTGNDAVARNTPVGTVAALIAIGYANGTWAGPGLTSSAAAANAAHLTALGSSQNDDGTGHPLYGPAAPLGNFDGYAPATADTLVRYTYYGDANLDGVVNGADYVRLDAGYTAASTAAPLSGWYNGDFNYDGRIDGSDYTLIDNAFDLRSAGLAPSVLAASTAEIAVAEPAAVPEPTAVGGFVVSAAAALLGRRRRA